VTFTKKDIGKKVRNETAGYLYDIFAIARTKNVSSMQK
jgi:ribosomal protein S17E